MALFLLIFASSRIFQDKDDFKSFNSLLSSCFFILSSFSYLLNKSLVRPWHLLSFNKLKKRDNIYFHSLFDTSFYSALDHKMVCGKQWILFPQCWKWTQILNMTIWQRVVWAAVCQYLRAHTEHKWKESNFWTLPDPFCWARWTPSQKWKTQRPYTSLWSSNFLF